MIIVLWPIGQMPRTARWMGKLFALSLALAVVSTFSAAVAQESTELRPNRIQIEYLKPKNVALDNVYELMRERKVLERFKEFLSPLRLPRELLLKVEACDGEINAWYTDDAVTVCYEYLDNILQNAPQQTTPAGVTRTDAIIGPVLDVFLHEVGHAVFDYNQVPILGREEDAADQFAAYILLKFSKGDARRLARRRSLRICSRCLGPNQKEESLC